MTDKLPIQKQYDGVDLKTRKYKYAVDIFCFKCLTHEIYFEGGHSWSPDLCPCGCQDTMVWYKMSFLQRWKAQKVYDKNERIKNKNGNE